MNTAYNDNDSVGGYDLDFSRILYMLYANLDNLDRQSDTKAQIFLGVNALLLATVANVAPGFGQNLISPDASIFGRVGTALVVGMIVVLVISIYFALTTTVPRLVHSTEHNLLFFGTIASKTQDEYLREFRAMSLETVKTDVLRQIHVRARIVQSKFRTVNRSGVFLLAGVLLWGLSRLVLAFA
jgi:hypothetical protein